MCSAFIGARALCLLCLGAPLTLLACGVAATRGRPEPASGTALVHHVVRLYGLDSGYSIQTPYALFQGADGRMWLGGGMLGGFRGVQRLDGAEDKWKKFPNAAIANTVDRIAEGPIGTIWALKTQELSGRMAYFDGLGWHEVDRESGPPQVRENVLNTVSRVIARPVSKILSVHGRKLLRCGGLRRYER